MPDPNRPPLPAADAFAEMARISLAEHSVDSAMARVAQLVQQTLPGAAQVSVTVREEDAVRTAAATGRLAVDLDERQYAAGAGPCLEALASGRPVRVPSVQQEQRWPRYSAYARDAGCGSSVSVPVPGGSEVAAALNVYSQAERALDDADLEVASAFAACAGVALSGLRLYEAQARVARQLQTAMESRAVIEQAKGVLMSQRHCTADEAFEALVDRSQASNTKLRDVARAVVEQATGRPAD